MIPRLLENKIIDIITKEQKLILIYGPRQAGKTTLIKSLQTRLAALYPQSLYLNADIDEDRSYIDTTALTPLTQLLSKTNLLLVDEAQQLKNPGLTLKIIHDHLSHVHVIATGSSSFELRNKLSDALTGRYLDFTLYPLALKELAATLDSSDNPIIAKSKIDQLIPNLLIYGLYPEIALEPHPPMKQTKLRKLVESYLFRDILTFQKVRNSATIYNLTCALAYQIGSEVSEHELGNRIGIDRKTVRHYIDLLEQTFIIVRSSAFSSNQRREIGRNYKVYFVDLGLRNSLINDFNPAHIRADIGHLWENFVIVERIKQAVNRGEYLNPFFWRTYNGAEIDLIEKRANGKLAAFECKYRPHTLSRGTRTFIAQYKTPVTAINKDNYYDFIL